MASHSLARRSPGAGVERWSLVAAVAIMAVWGVNFTFVKYVLDNIGVGPFLFIRFLTMPLLGFLLLALVYRRHLAKSWPLREDLPRFVACGLVGHTAHVGLVTWGIDLSTAFSSALVLTGGPLFTLLILAYAGVEKLRRRQLAGTFAAFLGIVIFLSDKFVRGVALAGAGDLVLLFAASLFSLYTVIARPITERYGPLPVLAYSLLFGAPPLVLVTAPSFFAAPLHALPPLVWLGLVWAIFVSAFLGWLVWAWVNAVRGLARSAPLQYLMPPIAGLVAWLTLGEHFTPMKIGGAALTMAGVAWAQFGGGHAPPRETAQADTP
ncbi:MAG TPA: DMT family transporter [Burkholderiales bacterium]|nr:DMT family transporter [Burkholderiales bacterium]